MLLYKRRPTANDVRHQIAQNYIQWNSLLAISDGEKGETRDDDDAQAEYDIIADAVIDEIFYYFLEGSHSLTIGATIEIRDCEDDKCRRDQFIMRDNNDLTVFITDDIHLVVTRGFSYKFPSPDHRHRFFKILCHKVLEALKDGGYKVSARNDFRQAVKLDENSIDHMIGNGSFSLLVRWDDDNFDFKAAQLKYQYQVDAFVNDEVSLDDILAGEKKPDPPRRNRL